MCSFLVANIWSSCLVHFFPDFYSDWQQKWKDFQFGRTETKWLQGGPSTQIQDSNKTDGTSTTCIFYLESVCLFVSQILAKCESIYPTTMPGVCSHFQKKVGALDISYRPNIKYDIFQWKYLCIHLLTCSLPTFSFKYL